MLLLTKYLYTILVVKVVSSEWVEITQRTTPKQTEVRRIFLKPTAKSDSMIPITEAELETYLKRPFTETQTKDFEDLLVYLHPIIPQKEHTNLEYKNEGENMNKTQTLGFITNTTSLRKVSGMLTTKLIKTTKKKTSSGTKQSGSLKKLSNITEEHRSNVKEQTATTTRRKSTIKKQSATSKKPTSSRRQSTEIENDKSTSKPQNSNTKKSNLKILDNKNSPKTKIETLDEFKNAEAFEEVNLPPVVNMEDKEKGYTYTGFLPLLKSIQSTLIRNSHNNVRGKLTLLEDLKNNLLLNIQDKISVLWKPNINNKVEGRDYHNNFMDFPSNEGALMTIGFLTFAVFLIKVVLQLLNSYRNNGTYMNPAIIGRKRRDVPASEDIKILQLIDEFKIN